MGRITFSLWEENCPPALLYVQARSFLKLGTHREKERGAHSAAAPPGALRSSQGRAEGPPQPLLLRVPTTAWDPPLSAASFTPTSHGDSPISPQTSPKPSRLVFPPHPTFPDAPSLSADLTPGAARRGAAPGPPRTHSASGDTALSTAGLRQPQRWGPHPNPNPPPEPRSPPTVDL